MTGPRVLPDYFGPSGDDIAGAFARRDQRKRLSAYDKRAQTESDLRVERGKYDLQHQEQLDPLEDAIKRATAREHGIVGPGEPQAPATPSSQALPPATAPTAPRSVQDDEGMNPGDPHHKMVDLYDMSPVAGTAHALPGAFNPTTMSHNPADVDLGGGYRLQGAQTPEGRHSRDASELAGAHIPGVTPELAMYLADHPEHISSFFERANRGRQRWEPGSEDEALDYEGKLAGLRHKESVRQSGQLTLEQALQQVDEAFSTRDPVSGGISSSQLNAPTRMRVAQEVMHGDYRHLRGSRKFGRAPVDQGQGGNTSKRHVTKDQQDYLQSKGKWDPSRYIVDPD